MQDSEIKTQTAIPIHTCIMHVNEIKEEEETQKKKKEMKKQKL